MANDEISDIGNSIEVGDNKAPLFGTLIQDIKAGSLVHIDSSKNIRKASTSYRAAGVLNKHYNVDLDTAISSGYQGNIITEGYVNMFCDDPGEDKEISEPIYDKPANAGIAPWSAGSATGQTFARIVYRVPNGDSVCRARIDRG
ncbi:MAG: hypothetical protein ACFFCE_05720 [Promethearchaeota archaeon]